MKFEVGTEQFLGGVSLASRFVQRQLSLPVLQTILIVADSGTIVLRATNLECGVEISLPAKIGEAGVAAVSGATLLGFLSNARSKSVSASLQGEILKLQTDRSSAQLKTVSHDDFPVLPRVSAENSFTIKSNDLIHALRSVIHCAATSAVKPELQSVMLGGEAGKLTVAATDSFRLAEKTVSLKSKGSVPQLLLPARNAAELIRILENSAGEIEIFYNQNQLSVQVGNIYYTSRLIDGAFPNYHQVVPKDFATEAVVLREDFSQALKGLSVFTDKFLQVSFVADPGRKTVELSSRNSDVGEEECQLKAAVSGDEVKMTFNSRYLADSVMPLTSESIRLQMNGPGKPMVVRGVSDDSFFYLAMPMNR